VKQLVELGNGRRASVHLFGEGDPLLYFAGGPGLPAMLNLIDAELLEDRFRVYLIDPHGSGDSTPPSDPASYDHLGHAAFYDDVRRALGLDRVWVGGVSFGGVVALTYAARYPDVVDRCLVVSARATGEDIAGEEAEAEMERNLLRHAGAPWYAEARKTIDEWTDRVLATDDPSEADEMMRVVLPLYLAEPDRPEVRAALERLAPYIQSDLVASKIWEGGLYQTIDLRPLLPAIRCPTLVVTGELDFICGPAHGRLVADAVESAQLVVLDGCGHIPSVEAPEAFRSAVEAWANDRIGSGRTG
jgi:proline iminopeptidase